MLYSQHMIIAYNVLIASHGCNELNALLKLITVYLRLAYGRKQLGLYSSFFMKHIDPFSSRAKKERSPAKRDISVYV